MDRYALIDAVAGEGDGGFVLISARYNGRSPDFRQRSTRLLQVHWQEIIRWTNVTNSHLRNEKLKP